MVHVIIIVDVTQLTSVVWRLAPHVVRPYSNISNPSKTTWTFFKMKISAVLEKYSLFLSETS